METIHFGIGMFFSDGIIKLFAIAVGVIEVILIFTFVSNFLYGFFANFFFFATFSLLAYLVYKSRFFEKWEEANMKAYEEAAKQNSIKKYGGIPTGYRDKMRPYNYLTVDSIIMGVLKVTWLVFAGSCAIFFTVLCLPQGRGL